MGVSGDGCPRDHPGVSFGSPGVPGHLRGINFSSSAYPGRPPGISLSSPGVPGAPQGPPKMAWELEKMGSVENAVPVSKNRGPRDLI